MAEVTRQTIIDAARQVALQDDGPISRADFERMSGISSYYIYEFFPEGGWSEVKRLAGLERHPKDKDPLSDDELLREFHRVASSLGRVPTWPIFSSMAGISADVIRRRFGGRQGTISHYRAWLELHDPSSPLLVQLQAETHQKIQASHFSRASVLSRQTTWSKNGGPLFGAPIDFRGLRHAPINEQGVVFLFGMVSYELGFIVEAIHATYPDCEAKRCVDRKTNRWQRVRIEFEFRSGNFRDHGHDPSGCDVIVCWEHNWPDCPIEVVELHRLIGDLRSDA